MSGGRTAGLVCAALMMAGPLAAQTAAAPPELQLRPLLDDMMTAANAHDTDRFLAPYLHDSTLVMVFNGRVIQGFDSVRTLQLQWWKHGTSDVVYSRRAPLIFTVLGRGAVIVTDRLHSERTDSTGAMHAADFGVTMAWQRRPEGWRIVAVHESVAP